LTTTSDFISGAAAHEKCIGMKAGIAAR